MIWALFATLAWADPTAPPTDEKCPEMYKVEFATTLGNFVVRVEREWSPRGADRFWHLVRSGYYDGNAMFRVLRGYVVQWGLHSDPQVTAAWADRTFADDPVLMPNLARRISFAASGEDTRRTQVFVNLAMNDNLDALGFAPFGRVTRGYGKLRKAYSLYGDEVEQSRIRLEGDAYLEANWPRLDRISHVRVIYP